MDDAAEPTDVGEKNGHIPFRLSAATEPWTQPLASGATENYLKSEIAHWKLTKKGMINQHVPFKHSIFQFQFVFFFSEMRVCLPILPKTCSCALFHVTNPKKT